jgi:hypothetical protein
MTSNNTHYLRFQHREDEAQHIGIAFTVNGDRVVVEKLHPYYEMLGARTMPIAEARNLYRKLTTELCDCYEEPRYVAVAENPAA